MSNHRMNQPLHTVRMLLWILAGVAVVGVGGAYFLIARNTVPMARGDAPMVEGAAGMSTVPPAQSPDAAVADLPVLFSAPRIQLTDQSAKPFDSAALSGHVWIAEFIFTRCPGACPILMEDMAALDKRLTDPRIQFVTITVDPDFDTPAVLSAKAASLGADARWHWLTGPHVDIVAIQSAMLIATAADQPVMHSTKLYLFDAAGQCRGRYDYSADDIALLARQAQKLANALGSPR
jgi:protein SCO1